MKNDPEKMFVLVAASKEKLEKAKRLLWKQMAVLGLTRKEHEDRLCLVDFIYDPKETDTDTVYFLSKKTYEKGQWARRQKGLRLVKEGDLMSLRDMEQDEDYPVLASPCSTAIAC
jgi:uncharacterized protein YpuA (DUF1002 family)